MEQKMVDSLNRLGGIKNKISFSIIEDSKLPGDNPDITSVGFFNEETAFNKIQVYILRYNKKEKKIVSIVKNQTSN
jgi:hypothetical protein